MFFGFFEANHVNIWPFVFGRKLKQIKWEAKSGFYMESNITFVKYRENKTLFWAKVCN